ncbi:hypothetical protein ABFS83_14G285300 [Erythranthe nasuta]
MLMTQSSLFSPPIQFSPKKICNETKKIALFSHSLRENKSLSSRKKIGKTGVLYNGYSYFTSPCHPLQLDLPNCFQGTDNDDEDDDVSDDGIGIVDFFQGKNILITGATGLLGKVIVEKILRSTPVGKIYLLIKAKDKEAAFHRLTNEIIDSDLFKCLKEEHGESYEAFVREKLIPVVGDICEPNMGLDSDSADALRKDVHVVIQSAASTTLNERYDVLIEANVTAPQRVMRFAKTCKNLKLFAQISTAYVNGRREGVMLEEPLIMGDNRRKEDCDANIPRLDISDEINLALKSCSAAASDYDVTKDLKKLGLERAELFGWYNTYHLTKAMGEMALNEIRGDVPVLIIRPTVIESSFKEPVPGWIQGNRMFDPVIISYGKGQLPAFFGNPEVTMDIIPVDMVANTTIAAIAKEANKNKPQLNVYHVASSNRNPLKYTDFFEYLYEYFNSAPLVESQNISRIEYFSDFNDFSEYTRGEISRQPETNNVQEDEHGNIIRKAQNKCRARVAYAQQLCKMYEFIGFFNARFDTRNTEKLVKEMSKEEKINFEVDVMNINWRKYFQEIHIPGVKKHIINGTTRASI